MRDVKLTPGALVSYQGTNARVVGAVSLETIVIERLSGGKREVAEVRELGPEIIPEVTKPGGFVPTVAGAELKEATRRFECIKPLLNSRTKAEVEARAAKYGCHRATVYRWIGSWERNERLHSLEKRKSSAGRGKGRLHAQREEIMSRTITTAYLTSQKHTMKEVASQVRKACDLVGVRPPHPNTVRKRIQWLKPQLIARKRLGRKAAEAYEPHPAQFGSATYPLAVVQMDHTKLDLMLVDDVHRLPIGRPWLTLAIDIFSRMITGYYLSLDPTGALAAGLCIANSMLRKDGWLQRHKIKAPWPCWGRMDCIHVDNAMEFRGKMLARSCQEYGIELDFRPVARPHFGGHIERLLGTLVRELHKLPGTTFSNVKHKGEYDSEGRACFTFDELDDFIGYWVTEVYHQTKHREIGMTPLEKYKSGFEGPNGRPLLSILPDNQKVLLDFMPFVERSVQRQGVVIDEIHYYHPVLAPWIHAMDPATKGPRKLIFKRDPRDISRVHFFDPENKEYREIPYRDTSRGVISLWELKLAKSKLAEQGTAADEAALFKAVDDLREKAKSAERKTRSARRALQRNRNQSKSVANAPMSAPVTIPPIDLTEGDEEMGPVEPYMERKKL